MSVGKRLGTMKSTESDVCYYEVDAVFNREPVELLEESTWTAGLLFLLFYFLSPNV